MALATGVEQVLENAAAAASVVVWLAVAVGRAAAFVVDGRAAALVVVARIGLRWVRIVVAAAAVAVGTRARRME